MEQAYRVQFTCGGKIVPIMSGYQSPQESLPKYRSLREICEEVARFYEVEPHALKRATRNMVVCRARQVAMWISKEITLHSTPAIGRYLGGRDHTTILHGIQKIDRLRVHDNKLADEIEYLIAELGGRPA